MIPKFPGVATAAARMAQSNARAALQEWIAANREQFIAHVQNNTDAAHQMLRLLCANYPEAATPIHGLMNTSRPDLAVNLIAMFDAESADRLRSLLPEVARLQEAWQGGNTE